MNSRWKSVSNGIFYLDGVKEYLMDLRGIQLCIHPAASDEGAVGWALIVHSNESQDIPLILWLKSEDQLPAEMEDHRTGATAMNGTWRAVEGIMYYDGIEEYVWQWHGFPMILYPAIHVDGRIGLALIAHSNCKKEPAYLMATWWQKEDGNTTAPDWVRWEPGEIADDLLGEFGEIVKKASELVEL